MSSNIEPKNATVAEPCCAHPGCEKPVAMEDIRFQTHHTRIETKTIHTYTNFTYSEEEFVQQMDDDNQVKWAALTHAQRQEAWDKLKEDFPFTLDTDRDCDANHIHSWDDEEDDEEEEEEDDNVGDHYDIEHDIDNQVALLEKHLEETVFSTPEERKAKAVDGIKNKIEALDASLFTQAEAFKAEFMKKVAAAREATEKQVADLRKQLADLTLATV